MRKSGILMHLASLPSEYGVGTMGAAARKFADFLSDAGQQYWQLLPICPTSYGDSPYQSFSTFAGNPYFIDLDLLASEGLLDKKEYVSVNWGDDVSRIDYGRLYEQRYPVLKLAAKRFLENESEDFETFCELQAFWLEDYALFMTLKDTHGGCSWWQWEDELKRRDHSAIDKVRETMAEQIAFWKVLQYFFFRQWKSLKQYVNDKGIDFIGDLPIYVSQDSVDVWAHPELFQLDENLMPKEVSGCPPDGFSATGQLWGNPLFDWDKMAEDDYAWWVGRIDYFCHIYDVLRIDHFRGFDSYFAIPYGAETAKDGYWKQGPGMKLFNAVEAKIGKQPIIAEDLGFLTDSVKKLLADSGFPGMKVFELGFDSRDTNGNGYQPHNFIRDCVAYTGTHDNETLAGWYRELKKEDKKFALRYMGRKKLSINEAVWEIIRLAQSSVADTCIIPIQDYLCLGNEARINHPSTLGGNWIWRLHKDEISKKLVKKIRRMTELYCRIPEKTEMTLKAEDAEDLGEEKK